MRDKGKKAMRGIKRRSGRIVTTVLRALSVGALSIPAMAGVAHATPTTPVPVCAGAKDLVVDVTQDVRSQPLAPARDGHMWANFDYTQHLRIWAVGAQQYCVRKDFVGTWVSIAGASPSLTGTISDGVTGTFTGTEYWEWTATLTPTAPTSGYLGVVNADCTAVDVCADDSFLIVNKYYFPVEGYRHCSLVRSVLEIDGGEHGHIGLSYDGGRRFTATGDITG